MILLSRAVELPLPLLTTLRSMRTVAPIAAPAAFLFRMLPAIFPRTAWLVPQSVHGFMALSAAHLARFSPPKLPADNAYQATPPRRPPHPPSQKSPPPPQATT